LGFLVYKSSFLCYLTGAKRLVGDPTTLALDWREGFPLV